MKWNVRFQHWTLASTTLLVVVLTGVFLFTVFGKFTSMSEENAEERFALISQRAAAEMTNNVLRNIGRAASAQASATPTLFVRDGKINQQDLVPGLMGALANYPNIYGQFFGLENDEFLQVIGVRGDEKIIAALKAPASTYFAVRRTTREADGKRVERWQFVDQAGLQLGELTVDATYAPSQRPWYVGALKRGELIVTDPYIFSSTGRLGLTVAAPLPGKAGVFGIDIDLGAIDAFLASLPLTPNAAVVMLDGRNQVMGFSGRGKNYAGLSIPPLTPLDAVRQSPVQGAEGPESRRRSADARVRTRRGKSAFCRHQPPDRVGRRDPLQDRCRGADD